MTIVTLGEVLIDMFPAELGRRLVELSAFHPKPGGAPANVAVAARRLGAPTAFIGRVGDDAFGHFLIDTLRAEDIDTRGMQIDPDARTTLAFIAMPDANHAEFVFYRNPGADIRLESAQLDRGILAGARAFHFGSISLTDEPGRTATLDAIRLARDGGALISYDVNYRPALWESPAAALQAARDMLPQVNLLKVNETELALLSGTDDATGSPDAMTTACAHLLDQGPDVVIVTLGPDGSYVQTAEGGARIPGYAVATVDAVGCGDAFIAAVLTRLAGAAGAAADDATGDWRSRLALDTLTGILRYANAVGALTSLTRGVIPALPTAAQVDQFLSQATAR